MEEMNHFGHKEHPLKLFENWDLIMGDDDEKKQIIWCYGCQEPISSGSDAYGCIPCRYFLHKTCAQLEPTIKHSYHLFQHPLTLVDRCLVPFWNCNVCNRKNIEEGFSYLCVECDFDVCILCALVAASIEKAAAALKEEAAVKFEHEGHPQHTLTLQLRPAAFCCDACKTEDKDLFYQCDECDFWIHKTCASLDPQINLPHHPNHPLLLAYSLPEKFYNFRYFCEFCDNLMLQSDWMYHCPNCRYFAHVKCALNAPQQSDGASAFSNAEDFEDNDAIMHFPMPDNSIDLLSLHFKNMGLEQASDDGAIEINDWSHDCPLILNVESQGNNMLDINSHDPIVVCYGCVRPLSLPHYSCKDGCEFFLHKYCAELPRTLKHQLHPYHLLDLVDFDHPDFCDYNCNGCFTFGDTFVYKCETCKFYLDVNCAFLPNTIKHESHEHPLVQIIDPKPICNACDKWAACMSYTCKSCNFQLDIKCAVKSPHSLAHRYCKGHAVQLTYPPIPNHLHDFFCDICETEMHPKFWQYYCAKCDNSFHLDCIGRLDWYANLNWVGTYSFPYHKHPITYVRRKKSPRYVCSNCNCDINGHLILECRSRICGFNICIPCHRKEINP